MVYYFLPVLDRYANASRNKICPFSKNILYCTYNIQTKFSMEKNTSNQPVNHTYYKNRAAVIGIICIILGAFLWATLSETILKLKNPTVTNTKDSTEPISNLPSSGNPRGAMPQPKQPTTSSVTELPPTNTGSNVPNTTTSPSTPSSSPTSTPPNNNPGGTGSATDSPVPITETSPTTQTPRANVEPDNFHAIDF
jgi:hypothetical protein